jgi:hypothetical protein
VRTVAVCKSSRRQSAHGQQHCIQARCSERPAVAASLRLLFARRSSPCVFSLFLCALSLLVPLPLGFSNRGSPHRPRTAALPFPPPLLEQTSTHATTQRTHVHPSLPIPPFRWRILAPRVRRKLPSWPSWPCSAWERWRRAHSVSSPSRRDTRYTGARTHTDAHSIHRTSLSARGC